MRKHAQQPAKSFPDGGQKYSQLKNLESYLVLPTVSNSSLPPTHDVATAFTLL